MRYSRAAPGFSNQAAAGLIRPSCDNRNRTFRVDGDLLTGEVRILMPASLILGYKASTGSG
jgi:hypothetical protein